MGSGPGGAEALSGPPAADIFAPMADEVLRAALVKRHLRATAASDGQHRSRMEAGDTAQSRGRYPGSPCSAWGTIGASGAALLGAAVATLVFMDDAGSAQVGVPRRLEEEASSAPGSAVIMANGETSIGFGLVSGRCTRAYGPFDVQLGQQGDAARTLGLWSSRTQHVACFDGPGSSGARSMEFVASVEPGLTDKEKKGQFGFGEGIGVSLRPNIETSAVWPLAADVESLGLDLAADQAFRTLALRTTKAGKLVDDMPLIFFRPRIKRWPIDVQFMNPAMGSCVPMQSASVGRFVCRATGDTIGKLAPMVILCGFCAETTSVGRTVLVQEHEPSGTRSVGKDATSSASAPWMGWTALVPEMGEAREWSVAVQEASSSVSSSPQKATSRRLASAAMEVASFEIVLIAGSTAVPWMVSPFERAFVKAAGLGIVLVAVMAAAATAAALLAVALGFPAPALAAQPALQAAVTALQFLALTGLRKHAPQYLNNLCRPLAWLMPADPSYATFYPLACLVIVLVVHGLVVLRYLVKNGSGSAASLPHGLLFGAWELRALSWIALPLAAASWTLVAQGTAWLGEDAASSNSFLGRALNVSGGSFLLLGLLGAAGLVSTRLITLFGDGRVLQVSLPDDGGLIFVDRVCDQLRTMPISPGQSRLFGRWPASPSWCFSVPVTKIHELEYRGTLAREQVYGSYRAVWSAGPWAPPLGSSATMADTAAPGFNPGSLLSARDSRLTHSNSKVLNRGSSRGLLGRANSKGFGRAVSLLSNVTTVEELAAWRQETASAVVKAHPVIATTSFPYRCHQSYSVAGVVGLPWVDAAVPATALRTIQSILGDFQLGSHVGQLSGPLTSGRLGACFEWGTHWPWWWVMDILGKVCLGAYVASLPHTMHIHSVWGLVLHAGMGVVILALAVAAIFCGPYGHLVDNLALASALAGMSATIASCQFFAHEQVFAISTYVVTALVLFIAVPAIIAITAAVLVVCFALRFSRKSLHDEVLPRVVRQWTRSTSDRTKAKKGEYMSVWCQDECLNPILDDPADMHRPTTALMFPRSATLKASQVPVELPVQLEVDVVHLQVMLPALPTGPRLEAAEESRQARFPLPADLLFTPPSMENVEWKTQLPIAALLSDRQGRLVYASSELNRGSEWEEVVKDYFGSQNKLLAMAAVKSIQEQQPVRARPGEDRGVLCIIEVLGELP